MASEITPDTLIKVGDIWATERHGEREIEQIIVLLQPSKDPVGDGEGGVAVQECEFSLPFVVDLIGGKWCYKSELLHRVEAPK